MFAPGDVLYGKLRPYLDKAVLADRDGICSTDILVLRPFSGLRSDFLAELVHTHSFRHHAIQTTRGVNHPRTSWVSLSQFHFHLPPHDEQKAIVRALRAVQDAKEARRREAELERERKAALSAQLFTVGFDRRGANPQWAIQPLGELAEVSYGLTVNQKRRNSPDKVPYLAVANVTRGALRLDTVKQIGMAQGDEDRYRLIRGDVLIVEGNGNPNLLGSAAVWSDELPFALHQNHLIRARCRTELLRPTWLMRFLNSDCGRVQLMGRAKTSSGLHSVNSRVIASLSVPVPALNEQDAAMAVFDAIEAKEAALEKEATLLDELFRAMLEELMSGRLRATALMEEGVLA